MHPNLLNSVEALQSSDSILHLLNCINYIVLYFILYIIVLMSYILVYSSEIKIHSFIHSWTNAAEIFFIILFDPKYTCLDIKSIFISGREDITKI